MFPLAIGSLPAPQGPLQFMQAVEKEFAPVASGSLALPAVVTPQNAGDKPQAAAVLPVKTEATEQPKSDPVTTAASKADIPAPQTSGFLAQLYAQSSFDTEAENSAYMPRYLPLVASTENIDFRRSGKINVLTYNAPPYEVLAKQGSDTRPYFSMASSAYQQATALLQ